MAPNWMRNENSLPSDIAGFNLTSLSQHICDSESYKNSNWRQEAMTDDLAN